VKSEKLNIILLVDWPNREIPRTLIQYGFTVFSYSPNGYSQAFIEPGPENNLIFRPTNHPPAHVDIVTIYRPAEEHAKIIAEHVLPLKAKVIWLQPPVESNETKQRAREHGLDFVQGKDIREISALH
jgi:predicted CoA-binding protein